MPPYGLLVIPTVTSTHQDVDSGNGLYSMVQILVIGLDVSIGGELVSLFSVKLGVATPAYRLAFFTMDVVTGLFILIFRKLDAKPMPLRTKSLESGLCKHAKDADASSRIPSNVQPSYGFMCV